MRTISISFVAVLAVAACSSRDTKPTARESVDPWRAVGIGSVFESRTVTRLERPFAHQTETTTRQTLLARNDAEASIKIELMSAGAGVSVSDVTVPLRADKVEPCEGTSVTTSEETCTVPAGTFDCTRTTVEVRQGDVTRSTVTWTTNGIPVPLKSVVANENMTTTTELTHLAVAQNAESSALRPGDQRR